MFRFIGKIILIFILGVLIFSIVHSGGLSGNLRMESIKDELSGIFGKVLFFKKNIDNQELEISKKNQETLLKEKVAGNGYELQSLSNESETTQDENEFNGTGDMIITLINKERFERDLKPLRKNNLLMKSALAKAEDMKSGQYFEHVSAEKIQPWFFAEKVGYHYQSFGENIAVRYFSANSVHKAFMDSPGHRQNILEKDFNDIGVAILPVTNKGLNKYIAVEHFGHFLKDINLEQENKYGEKSKFRCQVQKNKQKELAEMISAQEQRDNKTSDMPDDNNPKEINSKLRYLKEIRENVNNYLKVCEELKKYNL